MGTDNSKDGAVELIEVETKRFDEACMANYIYFHENMIICSFGGKYYFRVFNLETGEVIASEDSEEVEEGGKERTTHVVAVHQGMLYVGTETDVRVYKISEDSKSFKFLKSFGKNTNILPNLGRRSTKEDYDEFDRLRNGHRAKVTHFAFSKDYVITVFCEGGADGFCYVWDKQSHKLVHKLSSGGCITGMSNQGDYFAISQGNHVNLYDLSDKNFKNFAKIPNDYSKGYSKFAFCGDLFFVCEDEYFYLYKITKGKKLELFKKNRALGYNFGSTIRTNGDPLVWKSGNLLCLTVKDGKSVRMYDVRNKMFRKGEFMEDESHVFDLNVMGLLEDGDEDRFEGEGVRYVWFTDKYLYMAIGYLFISKWEIKVD